MLNQIVLVGRLANQPKLEKDEKEKESVKITLAVPRSYKNTEGVYETDFVPCILSNGLVSNSLEYLNQGDLIGVKGTVKSDDNGIKIQVEKLTFLSSKTKENNEIER